MKDCKSMKSKDMKDCKSMKDCHAQNSEKINKINKESQTVTPKSVNKLEGDPDINQSSGPGQGKIHVDKSHSLGVDEKKPSEGMDKPSVPEAPNDGRLKREHTVECPKDGPTIPSGGGSHPEYDQVEKYDPEKQDQVLGKENDIAAVAAIRRDEAVKIAGQLLKLNQITIDDLPRKINELSKATPEIIKHYETFIRQASSSKGLRKSASLEALEAPIVQKTAGQDETQSGLKENVQNLFTLSKRNQDYERHVQPGKLYR